MPEYLGSTFTVPETSEKSIHRIFIYDMLGAHIPLEDLIQEKPTIPSVSYHGSYDLADPMGAFRIARKKKELKFDIKIIKNVGHEMILKDPRHLVEDEARTITIIWLLDQLDFFTIYNYAAAYIIDYIYIYVFVNYELSS